MKGQTTIEYMLVLGIIALILIILIGFYYGIVQKQISSFPSASTYILNFQITGFQSNTIACSFNFSFDSAENITTLPIQLKINTITNKYYIVGINNTYYSGSNYYTTSGMYHYTYSSTLLPFNSTICGFFSTYKTANTATISDLIGYYNGKQYLYQLSPTSPTIYP